MEVEFIEQAEEGNHRSRIKVLSLGGAGGNTINNMIGSDLRGVEFIVADTDCDSLDRSRCKNKIQIGPESAMGRNTVDSEIGRASAEESLTEIKEVVGQTDTVFITAGMGGGTGTGASLVVARESRKAGAFTVALVTKPFNFEGEGRMKRALEGIERLQKEVDKVVVISLEQLKFGAKSFKDLIAKADDIMLQAVKEFSVQG